MERIQVIDDIQNTTPGADFKGRFPSFSPFSTGRKL
jgi:hypothetical protein